MAQDAALQKQMQRIGELLEQLESSADPNSRALATELLESLMALHGAGIERILTLASETGEAGAVIINKCAADELVSSLLLLYGLHPDDLPTRVARAMEKTRPFLQSHGASAEVTSIGEDGAVAVRLAMKAGGCGSTGATVQATLEAALQDAAPDAASIVVEDTAAITRSGFVSLTQLAGADSAAGLSAVRAPLQAAPRSGD